MSETVSDRNPQVDFVYDEEGPDKARIDSYASASALSYGDRVWYKASATSPKQGPYIVAKILPNGKYQLASVNNIRLLVLDGREVNESELEQTD